MYSRWLSWLDGAAAVGAAVGAVLTVGEPASPWLVAAVLGTLGVWQGGAALLRIGAPPRPRGPLEEWALLPLLALGTALWLGLLRRALPGVSGLPGAGRYLLLLCPLLLASRLLLLRRLEALRPRPEVFIVGTGLLARCTAEALLGRAHIAGHLRLPGEAVVEQVAGAPVLGEARQLEPLLSAQPVHEVYLAADTLQSGADVQEAIRVCERLGTPFALPACPFRLGRARARSASAHPDGYLHFVTHPAKPFQYALKRLLDITAATLALLVLAPVLLVLGLLVKLTSRGPVFFLQQRVGLHGQLFSMLKFRSMCQSAEHLLEGLQAHNEQAGPVFKLRKDPRVTPLGRVLRRHSLDELPQLINVLRGEMSLVGPRPALPREAARYEPWQRRRMSVPPGLTCLWQVSGRNDISFREWMYLDMRYIDHWNLAWDIGLILKTVPAVLTGRGAS